MSLTPGTRFGPYEILGALGAGGMGEVYRARDSRLQRMVAVKLLPPALAADASLRARFEQEARALAALNHPNIVAVYDVGEDEGRSYMVSELVEGESLRAALDRGPMPVRKANDAAIQMAEGMAAAHALGIVHRDLKPENVMLTPAGVVKLLDFGLAKQSVASSAAGEKTATMALSQPGTVMGTAGYMSPEQVRAENVDGRSDIFSFGCVLYEMVAGRRAFHGASAIETMHAVLSSEPDVESSNGRMPAGLATIVGRCLEKRPEQRFQSAADLAFALRALTGTNLSAIQTAAPARRNRWWPVAAAAAMALALLAGGYYARSFTARSEPQQFRRITFRKGSVSNARFMPDGRNVVYSASWEGGPSRIYLAVPGSPESRDLGAPDDSKLLSVSSKEELALLTRDGSLERISISGGQTRPQMDGVMDADWSPDGTSLAVMRRVNGTPRIEYPIGTLLVDKVRFAREAIRVSPDGGKVAYLHAGNGRSIALSVVDRAGKVEPLGQVSGQTAMNEISALSWSAKGDEIWFRSMDPEDTQTIYAIDLKGRKRVVTNLPSRVNFFDHSGYGGALLATGSWQFGIMGTAPGETVERDLSCLDQGFLMGISGDGRMIAASVAGDSGGPKGSIYIRKTDGSPAVRLGDGSAYRLSPDGKWVSGYSLQSDGSRRFGLFPTGAGEEVPLRMPGLELGLIWGWLGERRYLVAGELKGKPWQCFDYDAASNAVRAVCPEGVPQSYYFFVSPDSRYVLSPGPRGGWFAYRIDGGPVQEVHGINDDEEPVGWTAEGRSLYVARYRVTGPAVPVWTVDIASGKRAPWKELRLTHPEDSPGDLHLKVAPDGKAYAYNYSEIRSQLYVARGMQ